MDADGGDAGEEVDDAVLVVGEAVGVEAFADGGIAGFAFLVLVEDPFEGGAAAELVLPGLRGYAGEGGAVVQGDEVAFFVGAEDGAWGRRMRRPYIPTGGPRRGRRGRMIIRPCILTLQRPRFRRLEAQVQVQEIPAHAGPPGEVVLEVHAGELAAEVDLVALAVGRVVERGVGVSAFGIDTRPLAKTDPVDLP